MSVMVKSMMHERFYESGMAGFDPIALTAGWVTHQASSGRFAPAWNEAKTICLILVGDHFADAAAIPQRNGSGSATALQMARALLERYEAIGEGCLAELNGWFSGLVVDLRTGKAILFNDRYGLGRIYYHEAAEGFYFASEAKCLLKVLPHLRQLDSQSLGEYWSCGCVLQDRSLFHGISVLPAGSAWTLHADGRLAKRTYFSPETWEVRPRLSRSDFYEKLKATFQAILPRYLSGPGRIGLSLTGGLDSRMIMAWAPVGPFKLPCYTFGGMYRECADVRLGRQVAMAAQQYHEVISVHQNFFADFPALAKRAVYFTDGAMDVTGAVELQVNRLAREIAPVRLTGNYGDEILRRHVAFGPSAASGVLSKDFAASVDQAAATYEQEKRVPRLSFIAFKQTPWHHFGRFSLERTQVTPRSPYLDNDLVALAYQAPTDSGSDCDSALQLIQEGDSSLGRIPTDRGHRYGRLPLMSVLGQGLQKFTSKAEYAYDYGMPEWLARLDHLLRPLCLERLFLGRHKFYHFRTWYRDRLSTYVKDILLDSRTRSRAYLRGERLEPIVKRHLAGQSNHTLDITRMLSIELIQRNLVEAK
jgi:asparagine synthase (glutamine-hydrolysing)